MGNTRNGDLVENVCLAQPHFTSRIIYQDVSRPCNESMLHEGFSRYTTMLAPLKAMADQASVSKVLCNPSGILRRLERAVAPETRGEVTQHRESQFRMQA